MTYSDQAKTALKDRIGWSAPIQISNVVLSNNNKKSDSGRFFDGFNALVTVMNIKAVLPDPDTNNDTLNTVLYGYKTEAVLQVLKDVFDNNIRAHYSLNKRGKKIDKSGTDYSDMILNNLSVLDDAYGLEMARKILQIQITTNRSNATERNVKEVQNLRVELEGVYDDNGKLISPGIKGRYAKAIADAIDILFPDLPRNEKIITNASRIW